MSDRHRAVRPSPVRRSGSRGRDDHTTSRQSTMRRLVPCPVRAGPHTPLLVYCGLPRHLLPFRCRLARCCHSFRPRFGCFILHFVAGVARIISYSIASSPYLYFALAGVIRAVPFSFPVATVAASLFVPLPVCVVSSFCLSLVPTSFVVLPLQSSNTQP